MQITLKDLCSQAKQELEERYHGCLKPIDPEHLCTSAQGNYKLIEFPPTAAKNVKCPFCGSSHGRLVYKDRWMCCGDCYKGQGFSLEFPIWNKDHPHCPAGYEPHPTEKDYYVSKKIKSYELPKPSLVSDIGVPALLESASFDQCKQSPDRIEKLKKWSDKPTGLLIFKGGSGRGKSYAAVCCIKKYQEKGCSRSKFCNIIELCLVWKEHIANERAELDLMRKIEGLELLVLDDLGQREASPAFIDFLYLLIEKRLNNCQVGTIITTNFPSEVLRERLGDAIISRICTGEVFNFEGKDKRIATF